VAAGVVVFVWHRDNQNQRGESILPSLDRSSAPTPLETGNAAPCRTVQAPTLRGKCRRSILMLANQVMWECRPTSAFSAPQ
jgi:hypothetical protein